MSDVTYVFRDNQTYAIHQGKVIAASESADDVQRRVQAWMDNGGGDEGGYDYNGGNMDPESHGVDPRLHDDPHSPYYDEPCPKCGARQGAYEAGHCMACGHHEPKQDLGGINADLNGPGGFGEELGRGLGMQGAAKTVTTPNGLKGTVLGKVSGLWGDEVTVRLENGRIVKLPTGTQLNQVKTAAAPRTSPIEHLEARLAHTPVGTRQSLVARGTELQKVAGAASNLIREGVSYADSVKLDQIVIAAEVEGHEVTDAIAHIDDADSITAPSFSIAAADRTSRMSRENASWLDHTVSDMIKEAEATDFGKLMDEGPEQLTAELADAALADTGVTRDVASNFIAEKTAGIARDIADPYTTTFLARVEECRRAELHERKQITHKEAAAQEDQYSDLPDDALFL